LRNRRCRRIGHESWAWRRDGGGGNEIGEASDACGEWIARMRSPATGAVIPAKAGIQAVMSSDSRQSGRLIARNSEGPMDSSIRWSDAVMVHRTVRARALRAWVPAFAGMTASGSAFPNHVSRAANRVANR